MEASSDKMIFRDKDGLDKILPWVVGALIASMALIPFASHKTSETETPTRNSPPTSTQLANNPAPH